MSQMARQYRDLAKGNLLALVLNVADDTDAAPGQQMRDKMIDTALQAAKAELFSQCESCYNHWLRLGQLLI
jgi:hypothetical protein